MAAGLASAASHRATTTDLVPAWTVTPLAEFLGLAGGMIDKKDKGGELSRRVQDRRHGEGNREKRKVAVQGER